MADAVTRRIYELQVKLAQDSLRSLQQLQQNAANVDKRFGALTGTLKNFAIGFAGALSVNAVVSYTNSIIDAADALNDLSKSTDVSIKDLASLKLAAEQNGTSLETVAAAIQKINLSVSQSRSSKEMAESLKALGVNSTDAKERLFQLADAYAKAADKSKVLGDIQKVLGRGYKEMLPLLSEGGDKLRQMAQASESYAQTMARLAPNADQFNDQMAELRQTTAGLAATILTELVPAISDMAGEMNDGILVAGNFSEALRLFGLGLSPFKTAGEHLQQLGTQYVILTKKIEEAQKNRDDEEALDLEYARDDVLKQIKYLTLRKEAEARRLKAEKDAVAGTKSETDKFPEFTPPTKAVTDPLKGILDQTTTARIKEVNVLIELLDQRYRQGKLSTEQFKEAQALLNKEWEDASGLTKQKEVDAKQREAAYESEIFALESLQQAYEDARKAEEEWAKIAEDIKAAIKLPTDELETQLWRINELALRGLLSFEEQAAAINAAYKKAADEAKKGAEDLKGMDKVIADLGEKIDGYAADISGMLVDFASGADDAADSFSDFAESVLRDLAKMLTQMLLMEPAIAAIKAAIKGLQSGMSWSEILSAPAASAKGNVYTSASLSAYSNGVYSSPRMFAFASGAGIFAEAGPEAIMPLTRTPSGDLGVQAMGGGVEINVYNESSAKVETKVTETADGKRMVEMWVRDAVSKSIRQGSFDALLQTTYGLNRQGAR
jgi:hypothetical protein